MAMEQEDKDNLGDFRVILRWPDQPSKTKERAVYWHNLIAAVRRSYVEKDWPAWSDIAPVPNINAGKQLKHRLMHVWKDELPPGEWYFRVRTMDDGRVVLQGAYAYHENWNALVNIVGFHPIEHKFFRRFREADGRHEEWREVYLDWLAWVATIDHTVSPLDAVGMERLPSPSD